MRESPSIVPACLGRDVYHAHVEAASIRATLINRNLLERLNALRRAAEIRDQLC